MMLNNILTELNNGVLVITINRPNKLNALNAEVLQELKEVMNEVYNNTQITAAIITGAGNKAFIAGADIAAFASLSVTEAKALAVEGQNIFFKIENCPKPIIACVNGFALGGGCELAMSCHLRLASSNAQFAQPEVNLGLIPGYGGTQRLVQLIGKSKAMELLLTANTITATQALQYGLVIQVVETVEELLPQAFALLQKINSKAPLAIAQCIKAANAFNHTTQGFEVEAEAFAQCFATQDAKEGVAAFIEKRKPSFTGQ